MKNWKMELQLLVKRNQKEKLLQLPVAVVAVARQTERIQERRRMKMCKKKKQLAMPAKRMEPPEVVLQNNCGPFLLSSLMNLGLDLESITYQFSVLPTLLNTAQPHRVRHTSFLLQYLHHQ